jgi:hypothetical protein
MKTKLYLVLVFAFIVVACSKKDDHEEAPVPDVKIESFDPISIKFVHADGTLILTDECIGPDLEYAIEIETVKKSNGNTTVSEVEYTLNGTLYSISFSQAGLKRNPITLIEGNNMAKLVLKAISSEVKLVVQGDFTLVE